MNQVLGMVLISIAILIFVVATPTLVTAVKTGNGTALENETATIKQIYEQTPILIAFIPIIMFVVGLTLIFSKG